MQKGAESYLGFLYAMEDVAVYGYITPLKVKIVLALTLSDAVVKDADIIAVRRFVFYSRLPCGAERSSTDFQGVASCVLPRRREPVPQTRRAVGLYKRPRNPARCRKGPVEGIHAWRGRGRARCIGAHPVEYMILTPSECMRVTVRHASFFGSSPPAVPPHGSPRTVARTYPSRILLVAEPKVTPAFLLTLSALDHDD